MAIRILPARLANKIAAGEVIERPGSIVKELLENSIDAGATRIEIELEDAGASLIRVVDDGRGMDADDLALAFEGHATSKLEVEDDLFCIDSMGFRGEALASIGAVSHARIVSRPPGSDSGHEIEMRTGELGSLKACGAPVGTQVEVRNLFVNVPVRRKFLKTAATEMAHITEAVTRQALARPDIHFILTHEERKVFNLPPAADRAQRIGEFFGRQIADNLIPVERRSPELELEGYVLPPGVDRRNTRMQYTYVNGRYVRNKTLLHAISQGYEKLMPGGRRPICFIFIRMDPRQVDVNVHPTKLEVRFRRGSDVHQQVVMGIRDALREAKITPQVALAADEETGERQEGIRRAIGDFFTRRSGEDAPTGLSRGGGAGSGPAPVVQPRRPAVQYGNCVQMLDSFIIEEDEDGICIIDQHALHERILYNRIKERLEKGRLDSQQLLVPEVVELPKQEFYAILDLREELAQFGMQIEDFGEQTILVRAFPQILGKFDGKTFFEDLLDELAGPEGARKVDGRLDKLIRMMACHSAVKAGQRLSPEQIRHIMQQRSEAGPTDTCPHGRPTTIRLSHRELDKKFRRT